MRGKHVLDCGISTGGFTDCLLQHGAASVIGVDVGYGQVALSSDPSTVLLLDVQQSIMLLSHDSEPWKANLADLQAVHRPEPTIYETSSTFRMSRPPTYLPSYLLSKLVQYFTTHQTPPTPLGWRLPGKDAGEKLGPSPQSDFVPIISPCYWKAAKT